MADEQESWFTKWLRNGRLSAVIFVLVLAIYVAFSVLHITAPIIDQLLLTMSGVLVGNLAIKKQASDNAVKEQSNDNEKRVTELEKREEAKNDST